MTELKPTRTQIQRLDNWIPSVVVLTMQNKESDIKNPDKYLEYVFNNNEDKKTIYYRIVRQDLDSDSTTNVKEKNVLWIAFEQNGETKYLWYYDDQVSIIKNFSRSCDLSITDNY